MEGRIHGFQTVDVYVTEGRDVAIKQEGYMGDEDVVIALPPAVVPRLIELLRTAAQRAETANDGVSSEPPSLTVS